MGGFYFRMVNVDINPLVYDELKKRVKKNKLEYPSVKFLVHKLLMEKMEDERGAGRDS